ncbi:hypothetical protein DFP72DRAFT_808407 [Ephemerocybe angulata]|uniref:CxC5 like cysteine cluster associated with KDZ domain-containing protein n=1 Tax=Ephemerocybe angulata TaxID=980116 RepID=A0A8H6I3A3_9AGAR|nr:hypothetical protein DFP72DRAFT_808407 [Tulosesus angulatus]
MSSQPSFAHTNSPFLTSTLLDSIRTLHSLSAHLAESITLLDVLKFAVNAAHAEEFILLTQPAERPLQLVPVILPPAVCVMLSKCCGLPVAAMPHLWSAFGSQIWQQKTSLLQDDFAVYLVHGPEDQLLPPFRSCSNHGCTRTERGLRMNKVEQRRVVLLTLDRGAVPATSIHLYCEGTNIACKINYHHNYQVDVHRGRARWGRTTARRGLRLGRRGHS